jgi:hypothetical protein
MASIRDQILQALVARLAAVSVDWHVQLRAAVNPDDTKKVQVVVWQLGEDKTLATTDQYSASLQVRIYIVGHQEDADANLDAGNAYRYLDRLVVLAEKKIHAPDAWGVDPDFTDVVCNGHDVLDPEQDNQVEALLRLTFTYRHQAANPEA